MSVVRSFSPRLIGRITVLFALVCGSGAVGNALYTAQEQSAQILRLLERNALSEARGIAQHILSEVDRDSDALITLSPHLPDTPDLLAAALVAPDGRVISAFEHTHTTWRAAHRIPDDTPPQGLIARTRQQSFSPTGHLAIITWVPLTGNGQTVWLRTETDTPEARSTHASILQDSLLQALLSVLIGVVIFHIALKRPLGALQQCTEFAEKLEQPTGETLPVRTGSLDTDRLAQALNWASLSLYNQRTALAESEARTVAILGAAIDAVITFDSFGNVIEFNPAAERMLGWSATEAMQHPVIDLLVGVEDRAPNQSDLLQWLGQRFSSVIGQRMEMDIRHRSGRRFPAQVTMASTHMKGRTLFTAFISDISERRAAQAEMMRTRDAAEAANRAKSDFLANMSHEIRTPMNAIIGMTELALDTELDAEQREYLTLVKQSSDTLLTLIDDILDFSKIEAGHLDFEHIPFSLREVVGGMVRSMMPKPERPVSLSCYIDPSVTDGVVGDPVRLRQVLSNLLGNALKFTDRGSVELSVTQEGPASPAAQTIRFAVSDTGIGIPRDKQGLIFEAFSQADSSTTRRFGGTGLGLAICRRLVSRMGGELGVVSQPGEGSTFHFAISLAAASLHDLESLTSTRADAVRVWLIDEDSPRRDTLVELLRSMRVQCHVFSDALACLHALDSGTLEPAGVLLMPHDMACRNDWGLLQALRMRERLPPAVVLIVDGKHERDTLPPPVSATLSAPFTATAVMEALLRQPGSGASPRGGAAGGVTSMPGLAVLLAEDNEVNKALAVKLLQRLGHRVDVASTGLEAVTLALKNRYDLILMDVQMPQMGGLDATTHIRARERARRTPIVAMTAHAMAGDRERCLNAGMDGYVSKPIRVPALVQAIAEAVGQAALQPPAAMRPEPDATHENSRQFDRRFTLDNLGGDEALLHTIIGVFLQDYPNMLRDLREAPAARIPEQAHAIKGAIRNFGAAPAASIAAQLERASEASLDAGRIAALVERLADAVETLAGELRQELPA
ncbi:hybrid sensor histidine kinase/response regulator [Methyloversatilis thermotolerans]|uniref:hybrid sensor histidine kinase/response regulator n=1 Tax=Methyloversatilis thermotolerans TaxID=1346290 RepID=UPI0003A90656|nr:ATP-binding protein [Methyloversatilis thermotolerans]